MNLNDLYAFRTPDHLLDLRVLPRPQLRDIRDEAAATGDLETVAVIGTLLAGEEPTYLSGFIVEEIRSRLGDECDETDALAMIELLRDHGNLVDGWLVITSERWDELASEIPAREDKA